MDFRLSGSASRLRGGLCDHGNALTDALTFECSTAFRARLNCAWRRSQIATSSYLYARTSPLGQRRARRFVLRRSAPSTQMVYLLTLYLALRSFYHLLKKGGIARARRLLSR